MLGTIAPSDYVGFGLFLAFGLCWIIFPNTVIAFYTSFHRGRIRPAKPVNIRVAGVLWVALILSVFVLFVLR